jgi:hypothetical protein
MAEPDVAPDSITINIFSSNLTKSTVAAFASQS